MPTELWPANGRRIILEDMGHRDFYNGSPYHYDRALVPDGWQMISAIGCLNDHHSGHSMRKHLSIAALRKVAAELPGKPVRDSHRPGDVGRVVRCQFVQWPIDANPDPIDKQIYDRHGGRFGVLVLMAVPAQLAAVLRFGYIRGVSIGCTPSSLHLCGPASERVGEMEISSVDEISVCGTGGAIPAAQLLNCTLSTTKTTTQRRMINHRMDISAGIIGRTHSRIFHHAI
jgi:hypothetical protein